jgi:biotin carboxyl carrier protein
MTAEKDPVIAAVDDARALLDTLLTSGWRQLHVASGDTEIFLAHDGGAANPMRLVTPAPVVATPAAQAGLETVVPVPHVATLEQALAVGTQVIAGQAVATVRVLDEQQDIIAPTSGTIVRVDATPGALLEYGATLLSIAAAA